MWSIDHNGAVGAPGRDGANTPDASDHERHARTSFARESDVHGHASPGRSSSPLAAVSHELRTPLHVMTGLVDLLAATSLPEEASTLAHALRRHLDQVRSVVDDLHDTARLGAGEISLRTRPVDLRALVGDVVAHTRAAHPDRPVQVRADIDDDVPFQAVLDPARVRQVLANLLDNAMRFTPAGTVTVHLQATDGGVRCTITDTGVGIPPGEVAAVVEPFVTGSNAGSAAGAGLGLAIVRDLVTLMEGTVDLHSEAGDGTTVVVTLPTGDEPAAEHEAGGEATPVVHEGPLVLVVEDHPVNQVLAKRQLARLGMRAMVAESGEEAVQLAARPDSPGVVLMDLNLPGMSGADATRTIRQIDAVTGRQRVIIGLSAADTHADRNASLAAGMDDFLVKPVDLGTLRDTLRAWLDSTPAAGLPMPWAGTRVSPRPVDPAVLVELADDLGSADAVADLVRIYLHELNGRRAALLAAVDTGDRAAARLTAHTLKSSSFLLGAFDAGRACQRLEHLGEDDDLAAHVEQVLSHATAAARWFQQWLTGS